MLATIPEGDRLALLEAVAAPFGAAGPIRLLVVAIMLDDHIRPRRR